MRDLTENYPKIRDALHAHILEHFVEPLDHYGCQDEAAVCEVSAKSYDGFIAHTNGGFRALVHNDLRSVECEGLSDFESSCLQGYIDNSYNDAATDFVAENENLQAEFDKSDIESALDWLFARRDLAEDLHERQDDIFAKVPFWQTEPGMEIEEYQDYQSEYLTEGGTFFYEVTALFYEKGHRRNVTGADEIFIFAGINTDFEYGREKGLQTVFENTYKLERLTPARLRVIIETCANRIIH